MIAQIGTNFGKLWQKRQGFRSNLYKLLKTCMYSRQEQQQIVTWTIFTNLLLIWVLNRAMVHHVNFLQFSLIKYTHIYNSTTTNVTQSIQSDTHILLHRYNYSYCPLPMMLFFQPHLLRNYKIWFLVSSSSATRTLYV